MPTGMEARFRAGILYDKDGNPIDSANPLPVDITAVTPERVKIADDTGAQNANVLDSWWAAITSALNALLVRTVTETEKRIIESMPDVVATYVFLDAGASDERVSTITKTSATWDGIYGGARSYVKTFAWSGVAGAYYLNTITESVS